MNHPSPSPARNRITMAVLALVLALSAAACVDQGTTQAEKASTDAQRAISDSFSRVQASQPIPVFDWSAIRQTLIDVQTIQANGVATTTSFYLEGVGLILWCPSKGMPVPSTYQLSNSVQWVEQPGDGSNTELYSIDQGEATGVYVGESSGTYTLCLDDNGKPFAFYWEGYTASVSGLLDLPETQRVTLSGDPTYEFSEGLG